MGGGAFEELVECFAAKALIERDCCAVVTALEGQESFQPITSKKIAVSSLPAA